MVKLSIKKEKDDLNFVTMKIFTESVFSNKNVSLLQIENEWSKVVILTNK